MLAPLRWVGVLPGGERELVSRRAQGGGLYYRHPRRLLLDPPPSISGEQAEPLGWNACLFAAAAPALPPASFSL